MVRAIVEQTLHFEEIACPCVAADLDKDLCLLAREALRVSIVASLASCRPTVPHVQKRQPENQELPLLAELRLIRL